VGSQAEGNLTVTLPGGSGRAIAGGILDKLVYVMTFSASNGERRTVTTPPGESTVTLTLGLGAWTVRAVASLEGIPFGSGETGFSITDSRPKHVDLWMTSFFLTGFTAINDKLSSPDGGETAADPIPLKLSLDLSTGWTPLLTMLQTAGKYVALDLSACVMGQDVTEFNPYADTASGEGRIVSLVLPNAAESIAAGTWNNPTFKHFSALKSVAGGAVTGVGGYAFSGCTSLSSVNLPAVTTIGIYAFRGCSGLGSVSFPIAADIGSLAFNNCTGLGSVSLPVATIISGGTFDGCSALSSVNLPAAVTIDVNAFYGCGSLISVSLPFVTTIGNYAFEACTGLSSVNLPSAAAIGKGVFGQTGIGDLAVTLGGTVPTLGTDMFYGVDSTKSVTLKVPGNTEWNGIIAAYSGASTANDNWGNAFRGGGWDGTSYLDGTVNSSINLTILAE
jgi:hypothetical protein